MRWAIVLAGGVGSRFWPLSGAAKPKQLLPLTGPKPLLVDAIERLQPLIPPERAIVVTSRALAAAVRQAAPSLPAANILAEPRAASTAAALAWASAEIARRDPDASILSVHADWAVRDPAGFRQAAELALATAEREDVLVTVGARATRPETAYGWIIPGEPLGKDGARRIARFEEKPKPDRAAALMKEGAAWNTGLFAWTAKRIAREIASHTPELHPGLPALERGDADGYFAAITPVTIDVGVWERTDRGAVVTAEFGWDDIGSWPALARARQADANGNVAVGNATPVDSHNCVLWSDGAPIVVYGVHDAVVVQANGVTMVTTKERAGDLKKLLDKLPPDLAGNRGA